MKKIAFLIIPLLFGSFFIPHAHAETSFRITIDEVINRRNITIEHPETKDKYLLYLSTGCGALEKAQVVDLIIRGELNSNHDQIKTDSIHSCKIEFAEIYNQKLYIDYVYHSDTRARAQDESEQEYTISFGKSCRLIPRYRDGYVYVLMGNDTLAKGDRIYLPNKDGQCSIDYLKPIENRVIRKVQEADTDSRPTMVTHVRAFPRNGKVFLNWRAAKDDKAIDHYIVSYSDYEINTKDVPLSEMPNQTKVKLTRFTVPDLTNDRSYFFYILAVDSADQWSSEWSRPAESTPKSSVLNVADSSPSTEMNLRIERESRLSFLIKWDRLKTSDRQTVIFDVDGDRSFARTDYSKNYIRILKRDQRKGKSLTIKVRSYDLRTLLKEESIEFEF